MMAEHIRRNNLWGWIAVAVSTAITCFWAFWGIVENFHEGWYSESLGFNLGMLLVQYLSPMLAFMGVALISTILPRAGAILHVLIGLLAIGFFRAFSNTATFLIILPLFGLGLMYWFGRPDPRRIASFVVVGIPLLTLLVSGIKPAMRVSQRMDDGELGMRYVEGNEVVLFWAPEGPGWPGVGGDWFQAQETCEFLSEDGLSLTPLTHEIWRLPTVEEAVRSMARHGQNSGGEWDDGTENAYYEITPDKESPLWDVYSQVIYWWTATKVDEARAYIIAYDGKVWPRSKDLGPDNLGFRCVKELEDPE